MSDTSKIMAETAVLMEDLNLLLDRLNERERANNDMPVGPFVDAVLARMDDLKDLGVDLQGYRDHISEKRHESRDEFEEAVSDFKFQLRNQQFEVAEDE